MGPKLSIDDFGTGLFFLELFSAISLVSVSKVDRSFVAHLGNRAENPSLVKAILALADSLDLEVIAEGIETEQQLEFLQRNSCLYGSGFSVLPTHGRRTSRRSPQQFRQLTPSGLAFRQSTQDFQVVPQG